MVYQIANAGYSLPVEVSLAMLQGMANLHLLGRIRRKTTVSPAVTWNAVTGRGTTNWVSTGANAGSAAGPEISTASLPIAGQRLEEVFSVDMNELLTASAYGAGKVKDLLQANIVVAASAIVRNLEDSLINGGGSLVGLKQLFAASTGGKSTVAYAGIDPATKPLWTNLHLTNGSNRALTKALLDGADVEIRTGSIIGNASDYDMLLTSPTTGLQYRGLYSQLQMPTVGGNVYDIGAQFAAFNGRPVLESQFVAQADGIYFVDSSKLMLHTFSAQTEPDQQLVVGMENATDLVGFELFRLPQMNPDQASFVLSLKPQLQISNRIAVARLDKLTP